jgi:hypothetical protein
MRIIVDHEPRALRLRISEEHSGCYVWSQRNLGDDYWEATIRKVAPLPRDVDAREGSLHCTSLFTDLSTSAREKLAQASLPRSFKAGTTVVEQGTSWQTRYSHCPQ